MAQSKGRPTKSRAGGKIYKIRYVKPDSLKHEDGTTCIGLTDHQKQIIKIEDQQTSDNEADTLIHEVMHQILNSYGITLPEDVEEMTADSLGKGIFAHVRENPEFWRFIFKAAMPHLETDGHE